MATMLVTCSDKLKYQFDRLNKITSMGKKNKAATYAMAYIVVNQIEITNEKFKQMETKLNDLCAKTDQAIKDASKQGD